MRLVEESSSINMIGPYLSTEAICPFCGKVNVFAFQESKASDVYPVDVCQHIRAKVVDDDGVNYFEFDA